jgi:hypothetical protein
MHSSIHSFGMQLSSFGDGSKIFNFHFATSSVYCVRVCECSCWWENTFSWENKKFKDTRFLFYSRNSMRKTSTNAGLGKDKTIAKGCFPPNKFGRPRMRLCNLLIVLLYNTTFDYTFGNKFSFRNFNKEFWSLGNFTWLNKKLFSTARNKETIKSALVDLRYNEDYLQQLFLLYFIINICKTIFLTLHLELKLCNTFWETRLTRVLIVWEHHSNVSNFIFNNTTKFQ